MLKRYSEALDVLVQFIIFCLEKNRPQELLAQEESVDTQIRCSPKLGVKHS